MSIASFFDPLALSFVAGTSFAVAWAQNGTAAMKRGLGALGGTLWINPEHQADEGFRAFLRIEHVVETRGINCADRIKAGGSFVTEAAELLANQRGHDRFQQAIQRLAAQRRAQMAASIRFWENIADCAPAVGMLGTVIGLILLFGQVDDASAIGEAMAIALLTTLYGLAIANLIAGPIAQRLARIAGDQLMWQDDLTLRLVDLGRREYADIARDHLKTPPRRFSDGDHDDDAALPARDDGDDTVMV